VHDLVIMGGFHNIRIRVLGEVRVQTTIVLGARRNVGGPLALHGHLIVPADE
jgi:hypothetical protein